MSKNPHLEIAASILKKAVAADESKYYAQSLLYYQEGVEILLRVIKDDTVDTNVKTKLRQNAENYIDRAEQIKRLLDKQKASSSYHEQIKISDGDIGYSYDRIFSPYCDGSLSVVEIDDPYIRESYQILNLVRLCEMFVKLHCPVRKIILNTFVDQPTSTNGQRQKTAFAELNESLAKFGAVLEIKHSDTLHDREVRFDNGWIFKLGRGLSYFKKAELGMFSIGYCEMDLRPCQETTIDIFHRSTVKTS